MSDPLIAALILAALLAVATAWATAIGRWRADHRLLAWQPRREVPWGLVDVVLAMVVLFAATFLAVALLRQGAGDISPDEMRSQDRAAELLLQSAASVFTVFVSLAVVVLWQRATPRDMGLAWRTIGNDLRLGVIAFLLLAPPTYLLQFLLVTIVDYESKHPLIELLRNDPSSQLVVAAIVSAVLVAPVVEEYFFRLLFQGWLEKFARKPAGPVEVWLGDGAGKNGQEPIDAPSDQAIGTSCWETSAKPPDETLSPPALWPIFVSSGVFALLHFSHGPDWIPLFFLACGLGYLYRQTHRIVPCIVVHFLLNAVSMGMFLFEVYG
ncbi:MAG: CPBP family intramembrane metalloprotease [Planctomycetes bacterium]|nr:CPBP family intramembrane metalloprotease [Planctomycetota bacterium]